ncbi:MAG: glutamine-synthetase adenylyltransferase, partial [Paracoccaceae bacterium]
MTSFENRITASPVPFDALRGREVLATLDPSFAKGPVAELISGSAGSSPYLARLLTRHAGSLSELLSQDPDATLHALCSDLVSEAAAAPSHSALGALMRQAKSRAALLIALSDLGGVWELANVTEALTKLADTCVETAAKWLMVRAVEAGNLPGLTSEQASAGTGLIILAMGKMGAYELNYSSDIDLIVLFDDSRFHEDDLTEVRSRFVKLTRDLVKLLSENTAQGYVFRTDLRLRPSPSTTPVCMAISAAERYYETVGRTWERAAHIKARPLVDEAAGDAYLQGLVPFIWRRNLDYAAIEDTQEMLRKIRAQKAQFTVDAMPGHDLKLGPGGIREIEFFAQTRQLIMGGRDPALRVRDTVGALSVLAGAGWIGQDVEASLVSSYQVLRGIEHRLQMIDDAQTHAVPRSPEARARLAALCGYPDATRFEATLADRLARVHATCEAFFSSGSGKAQVSQRNPDEQALEAAGFERPGDAVRTLSRWREAGIAATRSDRARALFAQLEPHIVSRLGQATQPDQALGHFDRFLTGLPAGVQVFSLFSANPQLLD